MKQNAPYSSMNTQQLIKAMDERGLPKPPNAGRIYGVAYMTDQEKAARNQMIATLKEDDHRRKSRLVPLLMWLTPTTIALVALYFQIAD